MLNTLALILMIFAACLFGINAWLAKNIGALGLCLLTIALIIQFGSTSHTVTF